MRVLIVDDHPVLRQGLSLLIQHEPDMITVGEAESAPDALKVIKEAKPDVAIVDISLKDSSGLELIKDIKVRFPNLPILVLSMHDESFYAERVLRAGAMGYVMKEEAAEKIVMAIRRVLKGEIYLSERMSNRLLSKLAGNRNDFAAFPTECLSDRELQVFEFIGQGQATRDIAEKLHLSVKTIEAHRESIKRKLNLKSATELLHRAIQWAQEGNSHK